MSFSALRSARKPKEAKSFIKDPVSNHATASEPLQQLETHDIGERTGPSVPHDDSTRLVHSLPITGLPTTLEIRQSAESGRGVYAKESFAIGECWSDEYSCQKRV